VASYPSPHDDTEFGTANRDLNSYLSQSFCTVPWHHFEVAWNHNVYLCCPSFLPIPIGDLTEDSPLAIWNSEKARAVRTSIADGSFRYCNKTICPDIVKRELPKRGRSGLLARDLLAPPTSLRVPAKLEKSVRNTAPLAPSLEYGPTRILLANDKSCNLACPSCRRQPLIAGGSERRRIQVIYDSLFAEVLRDASLLRMNGAGELFVSRPCRELLKRLTRKEFPRLHFEVITNGQLFCRRTYEDFDLKHRLDLVYVSMDAASSRTYNVVRPGGSFGQLLTNLRFLDELRQLAEDDFVLNLAFVVSVRNFSEIGDFVNLARMFNASASFSRIRNWGHLSPTEFLLLDVTNPNHPTHQEFKRTMASLEIEDSQVDWGDLVRYRHPSHRDVSD
jgi:Iron-sulfur cluster-binding domain